MVVALLEVEGCLLEVAIRTSLPTTVSGPGIVSAGDSSGEVDASDLDRGGDGSACAGSLIDSAETWVDMDPVCSTTSSTTPGWYAILCGRILERFINSRHKSLAMIRLKSRGNHAIVRDIKPYSANLSLTMKKIRLVPSCTYRGFSKADWIHRQRTMQQLSFGSHSGLISTTPPWLEDRKDCKGGGPVVEGERGAVMAAMAVGAWERRVGGKRDAKLESLGGATCASRPGQTRARQSRLLSISRHQTHLKPRLELVASKQQARSTQASKASSSSSRTPRICARVWSCFVQQLQLFFFFFCASQLCLLPSCFAMALPPALLRPALPCPPRLRACFAMPASSLLSTRTRLPGLLPRSFLLPPPPSSALPPAQQPGASPSIP